MQSLDFHKPDTRPLLTQVESMRIPLPLKKKACEVINRLLEMNTNLIFGLTHILTQVSQNYESDPHSLFDVDWQENQRLFKKWAYDNDSLIDKFLVHSNEHFSKIPSLFFKSYVRQNILDNNDPIMIQMSQKIKDDVKQHAFSNSLDKPTEISLIELQELQKFLGENPMHDQTILDSSKMMGGGGFGAQSQFHSHLGNHANKPLGFSQVQAQQNKFEPNLGYNETKKIVKKGSITLDNLFTRFIRGTEDYPNLSISKAQNSVFLAKKFYTPIYKHEIYDGTLQKTSKDLLGKELKINCFGLWVDSEDQVWTQCYFGPLYLFNNDLQLMEKFDGKKVDSTDRYELLHLFDKGSKIIWLNSSDHEGIVIIDVVSRMIVQKLPAMASTMSVQNIKVFNQNQEFAYVEGMQNISFYGVKDKFPRKNVNYKTLHAILANHWVLDFEVDDIQKTVYFCGYAAKDSRFNPYVTLHQLNTLDLLKIRKYQTTQSASLNKSQAHMLGTSSMLNYSDQGHMGQSGMMFQSQASQFDRTSKDGRHACFNHIKLASTLEAIFVCCSVPGEKACVYVFDTFHKQLDSLYTFDLMHSRSLFLFFYFYQFFIKLQEIDELDWILAMDITSDDRLLMVATDDQGVSKALLRMKESDVPQADQNLLSGRLSQRQKGNTADLRKSNLSPSNQKSHNHHHNHHQQQGFGLGMQQLHKKTLEDDDSLGDMEDLDLMEAPGRQQGRIKVQRG